MGTVFVCAVKPGKEDGLTDKQVGIIIGISIGVTCIIICVVVILCRHRSVLSPWLAGVQRAWLHYLHFVLLVSCRSPRVLAGKMPVPHFQGLRMWVGLCDARRLRKGGQPNRGSCVESCGIEHVLIFLPVWLLWKMDFVGRNCLLIPEVIYATKCCFLLGSGEG